MGEEQNGGDPTPNPQKGNGGNGGDNPLDKYQKIKEEYENQLSDKVLNIFTVKTLFKPCSSEEEFKKEEKKLFDKYVSMHNSKFVDEFNDRMETYNIELVQIRI